MWGGSEGEETGIWKAGKNTIVARTKKEGRKERRGEASLRKKKIDSILWEQCIKTWKG